ncbi:MAG TPA: HisA/HisF-related TIM barrel protein, partial [Solirubrobacterales bacterium]|nr:HisA/HisF-related TIM barrel protein [Solirubrobacterales bacterium]
MILYPAIDIRGGGAVRLLRGEYGDETAYDPDPADAARRWVAGGAEYLHVVDLDGAREGRPVNLEAIERITAAVPIPVQVGDRVGGVDIAGLGPARDRDHAAPRVDTDHDPLGTAGQAGGQEFGIAQGRGADDQARGTGRKQRLGRDRLTYPATDLDRDRNRGGDPLDRLQVDRTPFSGAVQIDNVQVLGAAGDPAT